MQKYYTIFSYVFIFTLIFLNQSLTILSQKNAPTPSPFYQCWDLNLEEIGKAQIASDNVNRVFISYQDGIVSAIDLNDGNQNWKTELGGNILSVIYKDGILYVLSSNESGSTLTLRSLGAETGIAKWQYSINISSPQNYDSSHISLLQTGELLFLITQTGDLYKFSKDKGEEIEKVSFSENITTQAKLINQEILIGTDRRNLIVYSTDNKATTKIPLTEIPTVIYVDAERIIASDKLGKLTSFKSKTNKKEWQTRVGAEVSDLTETEKGLIASSNDNFVYLISLKNGEKIWKRRFANRTATTIDTKTGNQVVAVNLNSNVSSLLEPKSGKIINQITLSDSNFFVGKPFFINGSIIFKTNTGLTSYSSDMKCAKNKRPEDDSGL